MTIKLTSLKNEAQTIDSVVIEPWATQHRSRITSAIQAAVSAGQCQAVEVPAVSGSSQVFVPESGDTIQLGNDAEMVTILPAATIATLTVNMPDRPYDGQVVRMAFGNEITEMTLVAGTGHVMGAYMPITGWADMFAGWIFNDSMSSWHQIGG